MLLQDMAGALPTKVTMGATATLLSASKATMVATGFRLPAETTAPMVVTANTKLAR